MVYEFDFYFFSILSRYCFCICGTCGSSGLPNVLHRCGISHRPQHHQTKIGKQILQVRAKSQCLLWNTTNHIFGNSLSCNTQLGDGYRCVLSISPIFYPWSAFLFYKTFKKDWTSPKGIVELCGIWIPAYANYLLHMRFKLQDRRLGQ